MKTISEDDLEKKYVTYSKPMKIMGLRIQSYPKEGMRLIDFIGLLPETWLEG